MRLWNGFAMLLVCPGCGSRYQVDTAAWPTTADDQGLPALRPRKVRCRACGETWMAVPEEDILELGDPLPPEPPARALSPSPPRSPSLPPSLRAETLAAAPPPPPDPLPRVAISPSVSSLRSRPAEPEPEPEEEPQRRRLRPWLLALLLAAAATIAALLWTGVVRPEHYGLPPIDLPPIELPQWADPARLNLSLPNVRVPTTPPPPLRLEIAAERRGMENGRTLWDVRGTLTNPTDRSLDVPAVELVLVDAAGNPVASWTARPEAARLAPGAATGFESSAIDPPASAARVRASLKPAGLGRM